MQARLSIILRNFQVIPLFLGLLSLLIVALGQPSFIPWLGPCAALCGYGLFWYVLRLYPFRRKRFWLSWIWYSAVCFIQLSWMSAIEYQGIYILFVWACLSICLGVQFGCLTLMIPFQKPLTFFRMLAIASLWTLLEWSRFYVLCGYSWNLAALALSNLYAMQFSAIFGVLGLSFWVILTNCFSLKAFSQKRISRYVAALFVASIPYLFGSAHLWYHEKEKSKKEEMDYSCLLVQTGLLPTAKVFVEGKEQVFVSPLEQWRRILTFLHQSEKIKGARVDLIVLPEASVPSLSGQHFYRLEEVKETFEEIFGQLPPGCFPLLKGSLEQGKREHVSNAFLAQTIANIFKSEVIIGLDHHSKEGKSFNSAFHFVPFAEKAERYDKQVLLPLAEYLPFKWLLPLVKNYGITGSFVQGKGPKIFYGKKRIAPSICYEETFPQKVIEGRRLGAELLVNITNDGWYPFSRLASQHYEHAKFRAVENGATLIRACNTGVTGVIDSLGHSIIKLEELDEDHLPLAGSLFACFNLYTYKTLYMIWGNFGIVSLSLFLLASFFLLKKHLCL